MTTPRHVSGTIKALEWRGTDPDYSRADCEFGCYEIINTHHDTGHVLHLAGSKSAEYHPTNAEAKAAAQADYSARILAAIQPDPEPQPVAWHPIETAPYGNPVIVRVGDEMFFRAVLCKNASLDEEGNDCDQWQADIEGEHPACWTDGACWEINSYGYASLQPSEWRPATPSSAGTVSVEAAYPLEVISTVARVSQTFASGCDRCDADDLEKLEEAGLMDRGVCEDEFGQDSLERGEVMWKFNAAGEAIVRAIAGEGGL